MQYLLCVQPQRAAHRSGWLRCGLAVAAALALLGCGTPSAGLGVGIPVGPFSIGVGVGSGGVSAGVGTGVGPVGVGVGVNQRGQVTGNAGVGASVGVGAARVGAGVGTSSVLLDPVSNRASGPATSAEPPAKGAVQWRDARGQVVPSCRVEGRC